MAKATGVLATGALGLAGLAGGEMPATPMDPTEPHTPHTRTLASFEDKEKPTGDEKDKGNEKPPSADEQAKQKLDELKSWEKASKDSHYLTELHMVTTQGHYMQMLGTWIQNTQGENDAKKAAFEKLAPHLYEFSVGSPKGNRMASGVIVTKAGNNMRSFFGLGALIPNTEVKNPPYAEAHIAAMPFTKVVINTDDTHLFIEFPEAPDGITLSPTNVKKIGQIFTDPNALDDKTTLPRYPEEDNKATTAPAIKLVKANIGPIAMTTGAGAEIRLDGAQGTEKNPLAITCTGNSNYVIGPNTKNVRLVFELPPAAGIQEKGVAIVPPDMARRFELTQTYTKGYPDDDQIRRHDSTATLYDAKNNVKIIFRGQQFSSEVVKGIEVASVSGALRLKGTDTDIDIMRNGMLEAGTFEVAEDGINSQPLHKQIFDACEKVKSQPKGHGK